MLSPLLSLLLGASLIKAQSGDNDTTVVKAAFSDAKIVPDVVPAFDPVFPLLVKFGDTPVSAGVQLSIAQTAQEPSFALVSGNAAIQGRPYLIAMVDPDAPTPSNTSISQVRHFLGADFVSSGPSAGTFPMANQSAALSNYMGPMPPAGSPAHRYVILCYLQASKGDVASPPAAAGFDASDFLNFNISKFVDAFPSGELTLVAGTFFRVAPDNGTASGGSGSGTSAGAGGSAAPTAPAGGAAGLGVGQGVWEALATLLVALAMTF